MKGDFEGGGPSPTTQGEEQALPTTKLEEEGIF